MAKLLIDWLNHDVKLSKEVFSLEEDFKNGFLLGELLHKYNQQSGFDKFTDAYHPDAKIVNFCLLEPTMRQIGVFFSSKVAFEIMNGKKGVMKTLLYETKIALDSIIKRSLLTKTTDSSGSPKILRVIPSFRPSFDQTKADTFQTAIRVLMENPKQVMMDKHMEKFTQKIESFRDSVSLGHSASLSLIETEVQQTKQVAKQRQEHEKEFMTAWDEINLKKWRENQLIAKKRKALVEKVHNETSHKSQKLKTLNIESDRSLALKDMNGFDERLRTEVFRDDASSSSIGLAMKTIPAQPNKGLPELTYLDREMLQGAMIETNKAMKESHEDLLIRQQIHGRRQRKFIRERESHHTDTLLLSAETDICTQLLNLGSSEILESQIQSQVLTHKYLIQENRRNRNRVVADLEEFDAQNEAEWQDVMTLREYERVVAPHISSQRERLQIYDEAQTSACRKRSLEIVSDVIDRLLDLTDWVASCRVAGLFHLTAPDILLSEASSGESLVPQEFWRDAITSFTSPLPMATSLPLATAINVHEDLPYRLSERPLCFDAEWLLKKPFEGSQALPLSVTVDLAKDGMALDAYLLQHSLSLSTVGDEEAGPDNFKQQLIAEFLASQDTQSLVEIIANATVDESLHSTVSKSDAVSDEPASHTVLPPEWLTSTPAKYMLGEAVVQIRSVTYPVPADPPLPEGIPTFKGRFALCGVSDTAKTELAKKLSEDFGLHVVRVYDLIHRGIEDGRSLSQSILLGDQAKATLTPRQLVHYELFQAVLDGHEISSALCVSILVEEIKWLGMMGAENDSGGGFVIADFPNTVEDVRLLTKALSGIDYQLPKPDSLDAASALALPFPRAHAQFDVSKCGLDAVFFLESDPEDLLAKKVGKRKDLRTGELIYIDESNNPNVQYLASVITPTLPKDIYAVELTTAVTELDRLSGFLEKLSLLRKFKSEFFEPFAILEDVYAVVSQFVPNQNALKVAAVATVETTCQRHDSVSSAASSVLLKDEPATPAPSPLRARMMSVRNITLREAEGIRAASPQQSSPVQQASFEPSTLRIVEPKTSFHALQKPLADILGRIWSVCESQSVQAFSTFFTAFRDVRFQSLQRRRALHDVVQVMLVRHDDRQSIFEDFRNGFNAVEDDFRFDTDTMNELHLRILELRTTLWNMSDVRKKEVESCIRKFAGDGVCSMLIYRCQCEGAALIQAELNRFMAGLHVLLDLFYTSQKCVRKEKYTNPIEETLPLPSVEAVSPGKGSGPAGGAKPKSRESDKKKPSASKAGVSKVKGDAGEVYRPPMAIAVLGNELGEIPHPEPLEDDEDSVVDAKGKAKPKPKVDKAKSTAKKGALDEGAKTDPLTIALGSAAEFIEGWSKGNFACARSQYGGDENLCASLESAIWYEAARGKFILEQIQQRVTAQTAWLTTREAEQVHKLRELNAARQKRELAATERLIEMAQEAVESYSPISEEWLICPDAIAVRKHRTVLPNKAVPIPPVVEAIFHDRFNEEQLDVAHSMLNLMHIGNRNVLEQDLLMWLKSVSNPIGPLVCSVQANGKFASLVLPKLLRENLVEVEYHTVEVKEVAGTDETEGLMTIDSVMTRLQTFISKFL